VSCEQVLKWALYIVMRE